MKLYTYWRSTAAYRVRIALNLKNIACVYEYVNLAGEDGAQKHPHYKAKNPQGFVPCLALDDGSILTQSLAIIEYLDQCYAGPNLLPENPLQKAEIQAFAQIIACDIHPINNLRILNYLSQELSVQEKQKTAWYHHWIRQGFYAIESMLEGTSGGKFCFGNQPSLADICLIPQVYNANRFQMDLSIYPIISSINNHCLTRKDFQQAAPEAQADAV